jgi:flagellar basal-body rod protein FlgG
MIRSLFSAATGMISQQQHVDTIANNIANVNTTGFKKSRVNFNDLLYDTIRPPGTENSAGEIVPEGIQIGHGTKVVSIAKVFTQGNLVETTISTDMAISGSGFFQVEIPSGDLAYTRDGSFRFNANGTLVTSDGYPIEPAITVPEDYAEFIVNKDGECFYTIPGDSTPVSAGTIELAMFANPSGLDASLGGNLLLETDASGSPILGQPGGTEGAGTIEQRYLENSNVQVVDEILGLIVAQRAYEANSRVITTSDEMLQTANNIRR